MGSIRTFAGKGLEGYNGSGRALAEAWLYAPSDVSVKEPAGDVWIVDYNNSRVRWVRAGSDTLVDYAGASQSLPDDNPNKLNHPSSITFAAGGGVLLVAWHNHQIRRIEGPQSVTSLWGENNVEAFGGDGGPASAARFDYPSSAVWGADSVLYISDQANYRIRAIAHDAADWAARTISTIAGTGARGTAPDGTLALQCPFDAPAGAAPFPALRLAISRDLRTLYVADTYNHRVRALDLATPGTPVRTVAGSGPTGAGAGGFAGDGGPATEARLNNPTDIDVDDDGTLYICDSFNHRIRAVGLDGVIRTVAGDGAAGWSGDGGSATAARLDQPNGIGLDASHGLLYIADSGNNRIRVVRLR